MEIKNIFSELAAQPAGSFLDVVQFNGSNVGACNITGTSPIWEMHPDTDELFYVLDGEFEITLLKDDGMEHFVAPAGSVFSIPKGLWHKPAAPQGVKLIYLTPGITLHSEAEDPRKEVAQKP
jgi:mannose-6-phosphate isomerase-like protein (cupin superfamily)